MKKKKAKKKVEALVPPPKGRRTIELKKIHPLCFTNSRRLPGAISVRGRRREWVGFAWIEVGPEKGTEPILVEKGKMLPIKKSRKEK